MRCFLFLLGFTAQAFGAGLGSYSHLVVSDSAGAVRDGVRVTYLGTNGYQFEFKGHALLVDPYFSRVDLLSVSLGPRIQPNVSRINDGLRHLALIVLQPDAVVAAAGSTRYGSYELFIPQNIDGRLEAELYDAVRGSLGTASDPNGLPPSIRHAAVASPGAAPNRRRSAAPPGWRRPRGS